MWVLRGFSIDVGYETLGRGWVLPEAGAGDWAKTKRHIPDVFTELLLLLLHIFLLHSWAYK